MSKKMEEIEREVSGLLEWRNRVEEYLRELVQMKREIKGLREEISGVRGDLQRVSTRLDMLERTTEVQIEREQRGLHSILSPGIQASIGIEGFDIG